MGHDVLTTTEAGKANQGIPDEDVLDYAAQTGRVLLTLNRRDFILLHNRNSNHAGIIVCSQDPDSIGQASRIHAVISGKENQPGVLFRVNRPS